MEKRNNITGGVLLILIGAFFLLRQVAPEWFELIFGSDFSWPWIIIGIGLVFLVSAILSRNGELAIPGVMIGGIGLILNYQNMTGDWGSWAYLWTLLPGLGGLGTLIGGLLDGKRSWQEGVTPIIFSIILFAIFGGAFGNFDGPYIQFWPLILVALGFWIIIRGAVRRPPAG